MTVYDRVVLLRQWQPVLCLAFVTVLAAGCGGSKSSPATATESSPAIGTQAWDKYGFLDVYTAGGWQKTGWFRGQYPNYALLSYQEQLKYKIGPDANGLTWIYDYDHQTQFAQDDNTKQLYIYTSDGRLLTPAEYATEQAQAQAQAQEQPITSAPSSPPQPIGGTSPPPASASGSVQMTYQDVQNWEDYWNNKAAEIWVQPECNFSYNGCAP